MFDILPLKLRAKQIDAIILIEPFLEVRTTIIITFAGPQEQNGVPKGWLEKVAKNTARILDH